MEAAELERLPQILTPCSSGRRRSGDPNSPEFEFWMVRNPSFPQPNLLSADELFSDGVLLPLHLLQHPDEPPPQEPEPSGSDRVPEPEFSSTNELAELSAATTTLTSSKRWRDIFKKNDKKNSQASNADDQGVKEKDGGVKEKKREIKKNGGVGAGNGVSAAELNINIWPFSRSRSAGNGGTRPRSAAASRKVSSAPCSRSNSAGESKSRKWPSSPGRAAGVHLGRSSPVWQVRRSGGAGRASESSVVKRAEKGVKKDGNEGRRKAPVSAAAGAAPKARVLSLKVPMCIGYRQHLSCRSDQTSAGSVAAAAGSQNDGDVAGEGVRGSNLFNIRSLFTKKVY
ncbi:hypothetical protein Salat_0273900 [Sesamum alatum]|uniref:Uncharacterized protein n=1 Tax=Sesamum alatum TaxID=300844 RepID=A0AAE1YZ77_9LAMI|nr:hypothetical protein Salat_0273900 [Sesamum alatum]